MVRDNWYGKRINGKLEVYNMLQTDPVGLFQKISKGEAKNELTHPEEKIPDLRELLLLYANFKLKLSLGRDWQLIKIFGVYSSMEEHINLLYEKSSSLGLPERETLEPPSFFKKLSESENPNHKLIGELGIKLIRSREDMGREIESESKILFPNSTRVIDPLLCVELLAHFTGMERLAIASASAIQIAGSERALFMSKTKQVRGPKHGIIFKSSLVSGVSQDKRGKAARKLAGKLAICFRADLLHDEFSQSQIDSFLASIKNLS